MNDSAHILIVDDQPSNVMLLEGILQEEDFTSYRSITDSREVLPAFIDYLPDLILLDLQMPYLDGFAVMKQLQACIAPGDLLPILVLTADITADTKRRALSEGALDFLTKPFDATEVVLRIKNLLQTRSLHLQLQKQNEALDEKVRERTADLEATQVEILERLALAAEYRDDDTGQHTKRVGETAARIAEALGWTPAEVELIRRAAPLHDVGKIHSRLRTFGCVVATLTIKTAGRDEVASWRQVGGLHRRIALYQNHPDIGGDDLELAGSHPLTTAWTREHHRDAAEWTIPVEYATVLDACDND